MSRSRGLISVWLAYVIDEGLSVGLLPRLGTRLNHSHARERFEAKGRFENHLQPAPVWVIEAEQLRALWGASKTLDMSAGV